MFQRAILTAVFLTNVVRADITVTVDRLRGEQATKPAVFPIAPLPALDDLAAGATLNFSGGTHNLANIGTGPGTGAESGAGGAP